MHRLVPWLDRELHYLLNENLGHISYVLNRILELLRQYHINSFEFREAMRRYFGDRTEHFLHELYCFASTPYDMTGYDRNVQYTTDTRISTMVNEVISSSDSEASVDSDIMMVSSSEPSDLSAGPSRMRTASATVPAPTPVSAPAPTYPHHYIPTPIHSTTIPPAAPPPAQNVIPIETISHSDSDDDSSEVMVVGYIKPPQERTPEVVDLLGSDSDVVVQESPQRERPSESEQSRLLVKLSMKMRRSSENGNSDSDDSYRPPTTPPPAPPAKRRRTTHSADAVTTTSDTCRTTPSPTVSALAPHSPNSAHFFAANNWEDSAAISSSSRDWSSRSIFSSDTSSSSYSDSSSTEDDSSWSESDVKRSKVSKKKTKKKSSKDGNTSSRSRRKYKKRTSRKSKKETRNKCKFYSGKDVKTSKKSNESCEITSDTLPPSNHEQAGPSGITSDQKSKNRSKTSKKCVDVSTLVENMQDYSEQQHQCKLSSKQKQKLKEKSSKKINDTAVFSTLQSQEEQNLVDNCRTSKPKSTKGPVLNLVDMFAGHHNEDQEPGSSGTSGSNKCKVVKEKSTKRSNETATALTHIYRKHNHDVQKPINNYLVTKDKIHRDSEPLPGPSGISGNMRHKSSREKSSIKFELVQASVPIPTPKDEDGQPDLSDTSSNRKRRSSRDKSLKNYNEMSPDSVLTNEAVESVSSYKHKPTRDRNRRRPSRESKRLKSVVNIMYSNSNNNTGETNSQGSPGGHSNTSSNHTNSSNRIKRVCYDSSIQGSNPVRRPSSSDSEDDLPLNLTIQFLNSHT